MADDLEILADAKVRYFNEYLRAVPSADSIAQWQCEDDDGTCVDFGLQFCLDVEFAYQMGLAEDHGVDFRAMEYIDSSSATRKRVRRRSPKPPLPPHWAGSAGAIDVTATAKATMEKLISLSYTHESRYPSVIDVVCVRNAKLWEQYAFRRAQLLAEHAADEISCHRVNFPADLRLHQCDESINEVYLFHGTSEEGAQSIEQRGFDTRLLSSIHGLSVNFTASATRALKYPENGETRRTLILARVLLGDPYFSREATLGARRPASRDGQGFSPYDSVVSNVGGEEDQHLYDPWQTYPEYIVTVEL